MGSFPHYEPVLSSKATDFLIRLRRSKQETLVGLLQKLADNPKQLGDYSVKDNTGRDIQFMLVGDYVIGFWADHAVKEFRIVNIEKV